MPLSNESSSYELKFFSFDDLFTSLDDSKFMVNMDIFFDNNNNFKKGSITDDVKFFDKNMLSDSKNHDFMGYMKRGYFIPILKLNYNIDNEG